MTITDLVLILFILVLFAFAVYDQFIMPRRNGPVLLAIPLLLLFSRHQYPAVPCKRFDQLLRMAGIRFQQNIHTGLCFQSFHRCTSDMGHPYNGGFQQDRKSVV